MPHPAPPSSNAALTGQVALVTGAARGIGAACAMSLAARGAIVVCADRIDAGASVASIEARGGRAEAVALDVAVRAEVLAAVSNLLARLGRLDILVAAAGIMPRGTVAGDPAQWHRVLEVNLTGTWHCLSAVWGPMVRAGYGKIVLVSSIAAFAGGTIAGAEYIASKAGLVGLAMHAARNGAPLGVYCNVVVPGVIETAMNAELPKPEPASIPLGRLGRPEDGGEPVAFLCSPASNYLTGQVLHVNGGQRLG
ncbi:MAG: SDR family oxidoreductase [Burkholderiales bacterium]|nr:MAG: SDR family oxidoreductase [Burkholderiales bacterium]